ncbi:hypothetical protein AB0M95_02010 [Sphaerisporangium sp. NPDC051017]|uniref:hypothetical protein n=1 Tax=Sphaerisporangium sp. NPDC051017 TaxID=3154636 RepID=UPI00342B02CA
MTPINKKGPEGRATSHRGQYDQKAANDKATVQRPADKRSIPTQTSLPIVAGVLYVGGPARKTADLMVAGCPVCGRDHRHACPLPAPSLTSTKKPDCGARYQIVPKRAHATRRGRRAA